MADPYSYSNYHAAVWHEDLVELQSMNFISGVLGQTDYDFEMARFEELKKIFNAKENEDGDLIFYSEMDGKVQELIYSRPTYDEEDVFYSKTCAAIEGEISLTQDGVTALLDVAKYIQYTNEVADLVNPILKIKRYDTAIREASLLLESSIKNFYGINNYGQNLIDYHIEDIVNKNGGYYSAAIKCYRGELRSIFKFIRNDFAHNFKIITKNQCQLMLARIDETYQEFKEVVDVYYRDK